VADAGIPRDIKDFLGKYITSIEQFEILLLLFRQANKALSVDEVASELGAARPAVEKSLEELQRHGMIQLVDHRLGRYQYVHENDQLTQMVQRLSQLYSTRRVTILNLIFSRHLDRIRAFADSFKLTKKDTDG
jgi:predicted transcriptional regulator